MRCPNCSLQIRDGARSHGDCGWREGRSGLTVEQQRREEFDAMPPCYKCAGAGITLTDSGAYASCQCGRGKWMRVNAVLFTEGVAAIRPTPTAYHPELVALRDKYFPHDPDLTIQQRRERMTKANVAKSWPVDPSRVELRRRRNAQVAKMNEGSVTT